MSKSFEGNSISSPKHIYLDNSLYFITASTFHRQKLFNTEIKDLLQQLLDQVFSEYGWQLDHWVILDNHYHLLANSHKGQDLPKIMNKIHSLSAQRINQLRPSQEKEQQPVWYNYWDYCPRDEQDYNVRLCYLLSNPVKHGYVKTLFQWPWSSFHRLHADKGNTDLRDFFNQHHAYHDLRLAEDEF